MSKICKECLRDLPLDMFWKCSGRGLYGRKPRCKDCGKKWNARPEVIERKRNYLKSNKRKLKLKEWMANGGREKKNAFERLWKTTQKGKELRLRSNLKVRKSGRDKIYSKVWYYLRDKKKPCERCNSTLNVHAHHDDYSRPLDVIWLCPIHHKERHKELKCLNG